MNNLRGRLGSTRQVRGLGCNTDSSIFGPRHPELILVDNGGLAAVIEGGQRSCNSEAYATPSDLSRSSISERFDARLHGAGINDEENAGRYSIRMSATSGDRGSALVCERWVPHRGREIVWLMAVSALSNTAPHCYRNHGNLYIEEGMHTRSQQIFFGGGETRHENAEALKIGGSIELRHPASFSL